MLPTFVIGLREGLEAALIVGIIAAFLRKQGRRELLRWVFVGVGAAAVLCVAVGVTLEAVSENLPQRQQEGLETVIGALAVGMVTYMVVWMRRHSRALKGQLEGLAAGAMSGVGRAERAMVLMAFLAVLREGFETVVFLLAAFNESASGVGAPAGATLGLAVAVLLGYGIYRGGVRLNLSKFFRATGLVLVLVAAGLVVNVLHTAHEAGWLDAGQGATVELTWLARPGSVQAALLTGMLGIQPRPVAIELIGWLVYVVPVGLYVAWPPGRAVPRRVAVRGLLVAGAVSAGAAGVFALLVPGPPATGGVTSADDVSAQLVARSGAAAVVRTQFQRPLDREVGVPRDVDVQRAGTAERGGVATDVYRATLPGSAPAGAVVELSYARIAELNGGRLPIGLRRPGTDALPARLVDALELTVWVEPRTGRVVDVRWTERRTAVLARPGRQAIALAPPVSSASAALPASHVTAAGAAARAAVDRLDRRAHLHGLTTVSGVAAVLLSAAGGGVALASRRRRRPGRSQRYPAEQLVSS